MSSNDWDSAIIAFSDALRENPRSTLAYEYRGCAYAIKGDFDQAIGDFTKTIELDPSNGRIYCSRGSCFRAKGQLESALRDVSEALRLCPTNHIAWEERAYVYIMQGEFESAISDYREALRLDPSSSRAHNNLARLRATCPKAEMRNGKEAVAEATKACELTGWTKWNTVDTLAAALAEAGDYVQAVHWQAKGLEMTGAPEEARADMQKRLVLYEQEQPFREEPKE